jgi:hypothetical protein
MRAGLSFSHSPISLLLRQPLSIKKSYAGAIQQVYFLHTCIHHYFIRRIAEDAGIEHRTNAEFALTVRAAW